MAHVTFIHGISNKPEKSELLRVWKDALKAAKHPLDLSAEGISSEMVYWADVLHEHPISTESYEMDVESIVTEISSDGSEGSFQIESRDEVETRWIAAMEQRLGLPLEAGDDASINSEMGPEGTLAHELERFPFPGFVKDAFLKRFLKDVHHYLFNVSFSPRPGDTYCVQDEIRSRFADALKYGSQKSSPHIVIAHSMGTVIAYDCLKRVKECPKIDALVTIGSPLGIDEIQDKLQPGWTRDQGYPHEKVLRGWSNFFDELDPVSRLDPYLANDYRHNSQMIVQDIAQANDGIWRHDIAKYLQGEDVSLGINRLLKLSG